MPKLEPVKRRLALLTVFVMVALGVAFSVAYISHDCRRPHLVQGVALDASALDQWPSSPRQLQLMNPEGEIVGEGTIDELQADTFSMRIFTNLEEVDGVVLVDTNGNVLATAEGESTTEIVSRSRGSGCDRLQTITVVLSPSES